MGIVMWHWTVSCLYFSGGVVLVSEHNSYFVKVCDH